MAHVQTLTVQEHRTGCWEKFEEVTPGITFAFYFDFLCAKSSQGSRDFLRLLKWSGSIPLFLVGVKRLLNVLCFKNIGSPGLLAIMFTSWCRCMASSLVRTGFVRGSTTQGNGCYQHRCIDNTLQVYWGFGIAAYILWKS